MDPSSAHGSDDTGICPVKFGQFALLNSKPRFVTEYAETEKGVLKNVEVPRHGGSRHARISR